MKTSPEQFSTLATKICELLLIANIWEIDIGNDSQFQHMIPHSSISVLRKFHPQTLIKNGDIVNKPK